MPYTPPSQQSPASSTTSSPTISRSSSYHEDVPRSPNARHQPPRSMSSASYLHKHRRSPSLSKNDGPQTDQIVVAAANAAAAANASKTEASSTTSSAKRSSVKQSPSPVNNLRIPTGAVISPPDSSENSDGDEHSPQGERGRELEQNWQQLQLAVRALPQQRDGSPERDEQKIVETLINQSTSAPVTQVTSPTALSAAARKISHSRSSTETKIMIKTPTFDTSPTVTSDDDEDDEQLSKPALVRKKSGELVKPALRPSSRRRYSSMPGTPTYSKSVHFNDSDNQTRHFLQVDKPIAVSAGTSPVETYDSESEFPFDADAKPQLQIRIASLPEDSFERRSLPIRVERIYLSQDRDTLIGTCAVQNIAFQKLVVARFTLDYWKTTSEVVAEYSGGNHNDGCDRFTFHIRLADQANIASKTMLLCVRYNVGGQEFWDNNLNTNYQIDFSESKPTRSAKPAPAKTGNAAQKPHTAPPRSRHTSPLPRSKSHDSIDDDLIARLDKYNFGDDDHFMGDSPSSIKLKPRSKRGPMFSLGPPTSPNNGLGSRYDFGSSLSVALSNAQDKLGRQSGLMASSIASAKPAPNGGYFGVVDRKEPAKSAAKTERPDHLTTDRPAMGSDQYRDLVQKFCYFTPTVGKGATSPQPRGPASPNPHQPGTTNSTDGASENDSNSASTWSSGACSPVVNQHLDGASDRSNTSVPFSFPKQSTSPGAVTGQDRSSSSAQYGFPFHSHRDGYLSESSLTPTAIQG